MSAAEAPPPNQDRDQERSPHGMRWLSQDYARLRAKARANAEARTPYDVLIVGSGYGGAMAAAELAGRTVEENGKQRALRICVLERGREYVPGQFASSLQELPPHVRVHRSGSDQTIGPLDALLDVRVGPDVSTIVGNGLGGTSLINAGVMEIPKLDDCERLPPALRADLTKPYFEAVRQRLGASTTLAQDHPRVPKGGLPKTRALEQVALRAGLEFNPATNVGHRPAAITVQTQAGDRDVPQCKLCGDCMTGCNVGAKKSLDTTLLREAWERGAEIYTGGSVLKLKKTQARDGGGWTVQTVFTDESLRRRHLPQDIRARRVILAAGTLGSTEILLRSQTNGFKLSRKLGQHFSCNGDNLVAMHQVPDEVGATSEEHVRFDERVVGPTITSMIDLDGLLLQEFAIPAPMKRLFEESVTTANLLHNLTQPPARSSGVDSFAVDPAAMKKTLLVGLIGHDEASGKLTLADPRRMDDSRHVEGRLRIDWPRMRDSYLLDQAYGIAQELFAKGIAGLGERPGQPKPAFLPNPMWRLLPPDLEFLVKGARGPALTVHPLGGCPMGTTHLRGVVNQYGQVFDADNDENADDEGRQKLHDGLLVLDGSIIPGSLGANPALMIAAVAQRAAQRMVQEWRLSAQGPRGAAPRRPRFRLPDQCTPRKPRETQVQLVERLVGEVGRHVVELTLTYQPTPLVGLGCDETKTMTVQADRNSFLRVYARDPDEGERRKKGRDLLRRLIILPEAERDAQAIFIARMDGTLVLRQEVPGGPCKLLPQPLGWLFNGPTFRAASAWVLNRGLREAWDRWIARTSTDGMLTPTLFLASAARAAEVRCFDYELKLGKVLKGGDSALGQRLAEGTPLHGSKRLTYDRCANPWHQLTRMKLAGFPGGTGREVLQLDGRFLAGQGFPMLRITQQQNQVVALADLAAVGLAWTRMMVSIHLWSFRAPDPARTRKRELLPSTAKGRLPAPAVTEIELDAPRGGVPVRLRLTRYKPRPGRPQRPPIALIHGYSASGNTYTHEAIPRPLALHLWEEGRDVWVLDLRTSAGMPSAVVPWHFEDAALADIPVAIAYIREITKQDKVDVFAHCIGAVMLSMALLVDPLEQPSPYDRVDVADGGARPRRYWPQVAALKESIGKIVLSQKGPMLVYTDDNVLRAYFMRVLRRAILPEDYQFLVPDRQGVVGSLMDRLLATLPYPAEEFRRENPLLPWKRAPWAGFRHRMDALYARDFSVGNISDETLGAIQDLFGPLNLDTVSQAIHFARHNTATDGSGRAIDTLGATLRQRWPANGTLAIHGVDNGLADVQTLAVLERQMRHAGVPVRVQPIPGYGHQDCLIGRHAHRDVFVHVSNFLDGRHADCPKQETVGAAAELADLRPAT